MLLVNQCILITIQRSLYLIKFSVCFWISFLVLKAPFMYVSHAIWLLLSVTVLVLVFKWNLVLQGWTICSLSFLSFSFSLFNMCAHNSLDVLYKIQRKKKNLPSLYLFLFIFIFIYIFPIRKENSNGRLGDSPSSSSTQPHTQSCKEKRAHSWWVKTSK